MEHAHGRGHCHQLREAHPVAEGGNMSGCLHEYEERGVGGILPSPARR